MHPYENHEYWSARATWEGVATLSWSPLLNAAYYRRKQRYLMNWLSRTPQGGEVLEAGCGVGRMGIYIHHVRPDLQIIGLDFSERMLEIASATGVYSATVQADVTALPFPPKYFDLVVAMDVLFHVVRPSRKGLAWTELARVARSENMIAAYGSAHEVTSLVIMETLTRRILPRRLISQQFRDRLAIWLAQQCDEKRI